jgi:hypothetical protein
MKQASRWNISHKTEIKAPIDVVWAALIDIDDWKWNKWTRLEADEATEGRKGKLKASYEGNDEWLEFDFFFGKISEEDHVMTWKGSVGPGGCLFHGNHAMSLEVLDDNNNTTLLHHTEEFSGLLPRFGMGLPYQKLDRNYLLMNEGLKKYVESKV